MNDYERAVKFLMDLLDNPKKVYEICPICEKRCKKHNKITMVHNNDGSLDYIRCGPLYLSRNRKLNELRLTDKKETVTKRVLVDQ
jgi:hypothetical protein